jgi:trimeric autotransporter adhesin
MKVPNALLALGLMAALSPVAHLSFAQTAALKPATPIAASAPTAVPALVPYSGAVIAGDGKTFAPEAGVTFQIYKDEVGGEALWTESQTVATDSTGHYKVQLGATSPNGLPGDLFASGEARWLEVQVAGEAPQPRVLLVSVPYALKAADSATLGGLPPSAFALARPGSEAVGAISPAVIPNVTSNVTTTGGTAGHVPEFSGISTIVDSPIFVSGANVGIGTTTPTATLDVNGTAVLAGQLIADGGAYFGGTLEVEPAGTASASAGYNSQFFKMAGSAYNSTSKVVVNPRFEWEVEVTGNDTAAPGGTLNLLSSTTASTATETGFHFNSNGTINFASGQTFPGADITGVVHASGYDLGGSSFATGSASTGNAFFGFSGNSTATGGDDIGVGLTALNGLTSGSGNVAAGAYALYHDTTGSYNNAVGYGAAYFDTTASYNAAFGTDTLYFNTGSYNTGVGADALFSNTTGTENTGLGYGAGPSSGALTNATAVGYASTVSQSNSLILGQTTAGNPGKTFVNVGIGTATPRSILEVATSAAEALGPSLTLTNPVGSGDFGGSSVDFNTYLPSTTGTYNPSSRIEAFGDGGGGDSLWFLSNNDSSFGGSNLGLRLNMNIGSNGRVNIGTQDTDPNDFFEQLVVSSEPLEGSGETAAIGAFGGTPTGVTDANGSAGIYAVGGDGVGNAQADFAGDGGEFYGGFTPESSSGAAGYGIYATGGVGGVGVAAFAGYFDGNIEVTGTVFGSVKDFKIDHPLDPANKYLVHTSVESSEMVNIYSGNVITDELGLATVTMPDWFQAENTDFRYQLTIVDERFAQAVVSKRMENNQFTIHTNATNVQVSWQITAVRQDAYAKAHPVVVEQEKPASERGFYQNPELFGQPKEKQTEWARRPKAMQQMKLQQEARKAALAQNKSNGGGLRHDQPASAVNRNFASSARPVTIIKP